jgi:4-methyl-5(b-hydroxyethyl)-thiazole monophosphate biosynthesis
MPFERQLAEVHMPKVCVLLAEGFEEIEAVTIIDVLRRADVAPVTVAVGKNPVRGAHQLLVQADRGLGEAAKESWDMVILPGGMPGATNLRDDPRVQELLKRQAGEGRKIGAICAAPIALGKAGLLKGKKATSYPGFEDQLTGAAYQEAPVVRDGNIVTSRGPGTAMAFALDIVADLMGKAAADGLRKEMLVGAA